MRRSELSAALAVAISLFATNALAQAPPICPAPSADEFVKTVCVIDPTTDGCDATRLPPLSVAPGEILQYEVMRCNINAGIACVSILLDNLDALLPGRVDRLTFVPDPTTACGSPADLGGALCGVGPIGGPFFPLVAPEISRCGQDCAAPTDALGLAPAIAPPTLLNPDSCHQMIFRAVVGAIPDTECMCNQAQTVIDVSGLTADSNDPNWVSIAAAPTEVGCQDSDTCPNPGTCATCVKVPAVSDLTTSLKCIDFTTPACGDRILKAGGDPITYHFSVCNTGTIDATNIAVDDPLDFLSNTSQPCLDLRAGVTIANVTCSWLGGPCGPPDATIRWDGTSRVTGAVPTLPPGECVTWEAQATVATGFAGECTNVWTLTEGVLGGSPIPVNRPAFRSAGVLPIGSKCIDDGTGACEPTPPSRREGDPVSYIVEFTNVGTDQARDVVFVDIVPPCLTVDPTSLNCIIGATCGGGATCTPSFIGPDRVEAALNRFRAGCTIQLTYDTTVAVGATSPCCNNAEAVWTDPLPGGTATTADACFDIGDVVDLRTSSKCIDDGSGGCEVGVTHSPGDVLRYRVRLQNGGTVDAQDLTLTDLLPACLEGVRGGETCVADATCATLCTVLVSATAVSGTADLLATGCGVTYEFDALVIDDGSTTCCNQADAAWKLPTPGAVGPMESCFDLTPQLEVKKLVDGFSVAAVGPLGQKTFAITVTNNATGTVSCTLSDDVAATTCMTLDTATCTSTPNLGAALDCGVATANLVTATFDLAPSASQAIQVPVTAGATLGLCDNTVNVTCSGAAASSTASLDITNVRCDLAKAVDSPPVVRTAPWVYVNACAPGDDRIDNTTIIISAAPGTPISLTDSADPGTPSEITLYQLDCGCSGILRVVKTAAVGGVIRVLF